MTTGINTVTTGIRSVNTMSRSSGGIGGGELRGGWEKCSGSRSGVVVALSLRVLTLGLEKVVMLDLVLC